MASPEAVKLTGDDLVAPAKDTGLQKRFLGIRGIDWLKTAGCLTVLYVCVALVFDGLLSIASQVRQEEWLSLPDAYFGDYDKVEYFVDSQYLPDEWSLVYQKSNKTPKWNRANGCEAILDADGVASDTDFFCHGEKAWNVYPWIVDNNNAACTTGSFSTTKTDDGIEYTARNTDAGTFGTFVTFTYPHGIWSEPLATSLDGFSTCFNAAPTEFTTPKDFGVVSPVAVGQPF